MRPAFLVTIDTEGDNLWSRPRALTTRNAEHLPRFQSLCERCGLKPTYLTTWEMVGSQIFRSFGRDVLGRDAGEIGMHLHAWDSPPIDPLTDDDVHHHPYLVEFTEQRMREKVETLTDALEQAFGVAMRSHRAGRWAFDERYARILLNRGYRVDCSITPHVSWRSTKGVPWGGGGPDYRDFPQSAYFVDLDDIGRPGDSRLLEVPVTIRVYGGGAVPRFLRPVIRHLPLVRRVLPRPFWLRPNGRNRASLLKIVRDALKQGSRYVQFTLHSSELMPGGSPTFPTPESIEALYDDMEALFDFASRKFEGLTLMEFYVRERALQGRPLANARAQNPDPSGLTR